MEVPLFKSSGTLGGSALFKLTPTVKTEPPEQQHQQQTELFVTPPPKEEKRSTTTAASPAKPAQKRKLDDNEEQEEEPKKKQKKAKKKNKDQEMAPAAAVADPSEAEQAFQQAIAAITGVFRYISKNMLAKIEQFTHLRPAKSKAGLSRLNETVINYHRDLTSKIKEYKDIQKTYISRIREEFKTAFPKFSDQQLDKMSEIAGEAQANEAMMLALLLDPECTLHAVKALKHMATLPPPPSSAAD